MSASLQDAGHGAHAPSLPLPLERLTYTLSETARLLGISERFLRELIYQEYVPVLRLGRRVLVRRVTLERLVREPEGAESPLAQLLAERAERRQRERSGQRIAATTRTSLG